MTNETSNHEPGTVHGFKAKAGEITVEAKIVGGEYDVYGVRPEAKAVVEIHDPATHNTFSLAPETARRKAGLVEAHSPDESAGRGLAAEIRAAADEADGLLDPKTDGGREESGDGDGDAADDQVWVDTESGSVTVTTPDPGHKRRATLRERVVLGRARDNVEKWGVQPMTTLILALAEEVGELAEEALPGTCPAPNENPVAADAWWLLTRVSGTGKAVRDHLEEHHEEDGEPAPDAPDPLENAGNPQRLREEAYDAGALLAQIDWRLYLGRSGRDAAGPDGDTEPRDPHAFVDSDAPPDPDNRGGPWG